MTGASESEAREFAAAFRSFLEWVHSDHIEHNDVIALLRDYLGEGASEQSVVTRTLPPFEQVNLQTALDAWSREPGREVTVHGLSTPPHFGWINLQQLLTGGPMAPVRLSAPSLVDLPNGPGSTLACLQTALLLVSDADGRYVILLNPPSEHEPHPTFAVEIAGLSVQAAQAVHARLALARPMTILLLEPRHSSSSLTIRSRTSRSGSPRGITNDDPLARAERENFDSMPKLVKHLRQ